MNICEIEQRVRNIISNLSFDTFIFDLLLVYGKPKAAIDRLKKGNLNCSKRDNEILWKNQICFRTSHTHDLDSTLEQITQDKHVRKQTPRFLIACDYKNILALDTKTDNEINIPIKTLPEHFDFFLPLSGREKTTIYKDLEADVKAAEKMAKIYDEICKLNPNMRPQQKDAHGLNVFLSRLLFCFFADSTEIFQKNLFIETLSSFTEDDGSNLQEFFNDLFVRLNSNIPKDKYPKYLNAFPYVNGGLFKDQFKIPKFSLRLRKMIIDCGKLDWSYINPDIFGSMIQSVVDPKLRSGLGMHYTSVPNIMKVIRPLFLDNLYEELNSSKGCKKNLCKLYERLGKIRIFDPACGSGNFLIIAYKELRLFEIQLLKQLETLGKHPTFLSQIHLSQFYGIEIDEFACEVAKLSLWIAEHQMNKIAEQTFSKWAPSLPLKEGGHIVCGNATKLDWEKVCHQDQQVETYILGNPPYTGCFLQNLEQKDDIKRVFGGTIKLDYIACWFVKAAAFFKNRIGAFSFVSTNSICQGEQVALLWPKIFDCNLEIFFCYPPFKWTNNAKRNAAVMCVIVGIGHRDNHKKYIYHGDMKRSVKQITPYLTDQLSIVMTKRSKPLFELPEMVRGNEAADGGYLLLNSREKKELLLTNPGSEKFVRKTLGSDEYINGINQWCLWIKDEDLQVAKQFPGIKKRLESVRKERLKSKKNATREYGKCPHKFVGVRHQEAAAILIPRVSSEKREYIPIGILKRGAIVKDSAYAIYETSPWIFGILSSKIHIAWVRKVGGRLKSDLRYSSSICWNNFPIPQLTKEQKEIIRRKASLVLCEREKHPEKTIAELYDPQKMPAGLREAHRNLDAAVERCYRSKPFKNDEERLEHLFKLYEEMIQKEKSEKRA